MKLRQTAPWPIPAGAQVICQIKADYHQIKYTWQKKDWRYEARWHERTPHARLITRPSWRLDRVRPGKGFGPDAAPRLAQTLVGKQWLPTRRLRYCARRYNDGIATPAEIHLLQVAHPAPQEDHND